MSESVSNDVSTESLCTVIDAKLENNNYKNYKTNGIDKEASIQAERIFDYIENDCKPSNGHLSSSAHEETECETEPERSIIQKTETRSKLKKSVSFDPNDEKIKKFIAGDPIVDQQNPFKSNSLGKNKKKTPPPVPTKRSTLSVRKTVTQQLREREREKEKERERLKNEANTRKSLTNGTPNGSTTNGTFHTLNSPDDFVTTEEVLKQSKYVKTYIKNPDPYFVYDPTVLARIKFEELRELADKKPQRKLKAKDTQKASKKSSTPEGRTKLPTFKKCSKPNYPNLCDIKIKVGTDSDGSFFNPAEVTKNAKKFDERARKLHLSSDDDLDEIDGPLTKSESSDEVATNSVHSPQEKQEDSLFEEFKQEQQEMQSMNGQAHEQQQTQGTFTNTIKSKEFQEYLEKKGLTLIPKKIPNGAQALYQPNGVGTKQTPQYQATFKAPAQAQISAVTTNDKMETPTRKPSVFQRLLANSIFASRRRTTPKDTVPNARSVAYDANPYLKQSAGTPAPIKRVVLERQSFHARPRAANGLLSAAETNDLKRQTERSRKSFASGDDLSLSISSALTNAESDGDPESDAAEPIRKVKQTTPDRPIAKPPRRTLSRERLHKANGGNLPNGVSAAKPTLPNGTTSSIQSRENINPRDSVDGGGNFRRSLERQSLLPKRSMTDAERRQVFGRSSSMDRNEILKRNAMRGLQNRTRSINDTAEVIKPTATKVSSEEQFELKNGPMLTSTPIRDGSASNMESRSMAPVQVLPSNKPGSVLVEQQEWERLCAIKERTDRELYYQVLQQQQQHQKEQQQKEQQQQQEQNKPAQVNGNENIYERLEAEKSQRAAEQYFIRGSPQRNTFSGVSNNRQATIIDGKPVLMAQRANTSTAANNAIPNGNANGARSQSVLDNLTNNEQQSSRTPMRRGYESETETPVVLRRRGGGNIEKPEPRRIGGLLTREEIMQKVKEFCRKSLNKTPTNLSHQPVQQMQAIYERHATNSTDLSPVSYASVETQQRPVSRLYAAPQVPQRLQSLPQQFVPIKQELVAVDTNGTGGSPIYAHVIKRSSLQSQQSNDLYDSPQRPVLVRRASDAKTLYLTHAPNSLQLQQEATFSPVPTQYVIVDNDKLTPAQLVSLQPATELYAQPQYVRPSQLQAIPNTYGYITVREPLAQAQQIQLQQQPQQQQPQTYVRQRLHDGRSTPLILDRSSQQASQIYWTPQHQRLQQQSGLVPIQISPRYVIKQPAIYPIPAQRTSTLARTQNYLAAPNEIVYREVVKTVPQQQQQFSPIVRVQTPTRQLQRQTVQFQQQPMQAQQQQQQQQQRRTQQQRQQRQVESSDWESGSEAGEVRRIMENHRNHDFKQSQQELQAQQ